jgi:hypothetical protein
MRLSVLSVRVGAGKKRDADTKYNAKWLIFISNFYFVGVSVLSVQDK